MDVKIKCATCKADVTDAFVSANGNVYHHACYSDTAANIDRLTAQVRQLQEALTASEQERDALKEEIARLTTHSQCHCSGHMYWRDEAAKYKAGQ